MINTWASQLLLPSLGEACSFPCGSHEKEVSKLDGPIGVLSGEGSADKSHSSTYTYAMSVFKLSVKSCQTIHYSINRLWLGHNQDAKKIHWIKEDILCRRKEDGGLGFREIEAFNQAVLAKQFCRIHKDNSSW